MNPEIELRRRGVGAFSRNEAKPGRKKKMQREVEE
jgi:hypothetical protein